MPTQTFFRLPEEKRERLTEAAWREFLAVSYAEASINRIVREAQIPRGSFYQYFEDKEDLFFYLLSLGREESMGILTGVLDAAGGDPYDATLRLFDEVFSGGLRPSMKRVLEVLRLNQSMDVSQMLLLRMRSDPGLQKLEKQVNWEIFRRTDAEFVREMARLLVFSFACAIRSILCDDAPVASERVKLTARLEILRRGSMKEETA